MSISKSRDGHITCTWTPQDLVYLAPSSEGKKKNSAETICNKTHLTWRMPYVRTFFELLLKEHVPDCCLSYGTEECLKSSEEWLQNIYLDKYCKAQMGKNFVGKV